MGPVDTPLSKSSCIRLKSISSQEGNYGISNKQKNLAIPSVCQVLRLGSVKPRIQILCFMLCFGCGAGGRIVVEEKQLYEEGDPFILTCLCVSPQEAWRSPHFVSYQRTSCVYELTLVLCTQLLLPDFCSNGTAFLFSGIPLVSTRKCLYQ